MTQPANWNRGLDAKIITVETLLVGDWILVRRDNAPIDIPRFAKYACQVVDILRSSRDHSVEIELAGGHRILANADSKIGVMRGVTS